MTLPVGVETVTVSSGEPLVLPDGTPIQGHLVFTGPSLVTIGGQDVVLGGQVEVQLVDGEFTVSLCATDATGMSPTGWTYKVTAVLSNAPDWVRYISLPKASPSVILADIVTADPATSQTGRLVINAFGAATSGYPLGLSGAAESLSVLSSFAGGEDEGQPGQFDSTGRLNLYSYQRADVGSYGENIRRFLMRGNAKSMDAWYFPSGGYDGNLEPVGTFKPVVWAGAHWQANDGLSNHKHWSIETPDSTGAIQTRFEVRWGDPAVTNAIGGLDKTLIMTNLADLVVRCSNGQELRLSAAAGTEKAMTFSLDSLGGDSYRRWKVRATNETESGSNAGTNFQIGRYDDTGTFVDNPVVISRSTGNVTLGPGLVARRSSASVSSVSLNTTSLGGGVGVVAIGNAGTVPASNPTGGGVLYAEAGALKWRGPSGAITTVGAA